jgi:hypothetical protein
MKVYQFLFLIAVLLSCENSLTSEFDEKFAIYLLKEDSLTTSDVQDQPIFDIEVKINPILTYDDIVSYDLDTHQVFLHNDLSYYLGADSIRVFRNTQGIPFILVANGERIYLGSFLSGLSSWVPNTPKIVDYTLNTNEKSFVISGAPKYADKKYLDVRNDKRIFYALQDKLIKH